MAKHSRLKKNFIDAIYPEDKLRVKGLTEDYEGITLEVIRKIDNGGKRLETEIVPFTLLTKDAEAFAQAIIRATQICP